MAEPVKRPILPKISPTLPGVYVQEITKFGHTIPAAPTSIAAIIGTFPHGPQIPRKAIRSWSEFVRVYGKIPQGAVSSYGVKQFFENGGQSLWVLRIGSTIPQTASPYLKGLAILDRIPDWNLAFIPETAFLRPRQATQVYRAILPILDKHGAMYILDPPQPSNAVFKGVDLERWIKSHRFLQHNNVVLYFPRVLVPQSSNTRNTIPIPPSGSMAGIIARTDQTRGVWKAPAGREAVLRGVRGIEQTLTRAETERLTRANTNLLRPMSTLGVVAWGARTLSSDPEWKYIPVRRLAIFLETSIYRGLQWVVFEPNDEPLWIQIRQSIGSFFQTYFRKEAFQGRSPKEAYVVKCGYDTMTYQDQAAGTLKIILGFAPLKPAEFIMFHLRLKVQPKQRP